MTHRIVNGPAAWLGACLLALASAGAADSQTKGNPAGAMPPTGGGTTTDGTTDGGSALPPMARVVILLQAIDDVLTLTAAFGAQDVNELELLLFINVLYEQRVAAAEADVAGGGTPPGFGRLFGGLFGGG